MTTLSSYSLCPAGTGKKLKFCCHDLVGDLEKVDRMLEGKQHQAVLERISMLQSKHGPRACLFTYLCSLRIQISGVDEAARDIDAFAEAFPENPVACAFLALLSFSRDDLSLGMQSLQRALEFSSDAMSPVLLDVTLAMAKYLTSRGRVLSARALLRLLGTWVPEDKQVSQFLGELSRSGGIPLLLKQDFVLAECSETAAYKAPFDKALKLAARGLWRKAAETFERLASENGNDPDLWRSVAIVRTWLDDTQPALDAWRKYASLAEVPFEDAVEAEALAMLMDPEPPIEWVEQVRLEYEVDDLDTLLAALSAEKNTDTFDPRNFTEPDENEPPPKAAFVLLDRPVPETPEGLTAAEMPNILAQLLLYGRQTDRAPRIELVAYRGEPLEAARKRLAEIGGRALGAPAEEQVIGRIEMMQRLTRPDWKTPKGLLPDQFHDLLDEFNAATLSDRWLTLPARALDGKAPLDVAGDAAYRVRLAATLLVYEQDLEGRRIEVDLAPVRQRLGLPEAEPISAAEFDIENLPLTRLARVSVEELSDNQLAALQMKSMTFFARRAVYRATIEALGRPEMVGDESRAEQSLMLARLARKTDEQLDFLNQARQAAQQAGMPDWKYDLAEMEVRLIRGDSDEFMRLMKHLQAEHGDQPEVQRALFETLSRMGLVDSEGRVRQQPRGAETPTPDMVEEAPAEKDAAIWTPEGERESQGKSKLWVPGQD